MIANFGVSLYAEIELRPINFILSKEDGSLIDHEDNKSHIVYANKSYSSIDVALFPFINSKDIFFPLIKNVLNKQSESSSCADFFNSLTKNKELIAYTGIANIVGFSPLIWDSSYFVKKDWSLYYVVFSPSLYFWINSYGKYPTLIERFFYQKKESYKNFIEYSQPQFIKDFMDHSQRSFLEHVFTRDYNKNRVNFVLANKWDPVIRKWILEFEEKLSGSKKSDSEEGSTDFSDIGEDSE